jgi:hypothetical protein
MCGVAGVCECSKQGDPITLAKPRAFLPGGAAHESLLRAPAIDLRAGEQKTALG